jgi:hypothetical protein
MEVTITAIGSIEESPCYLVGKISSNNYVVFDLIKPATTSDFDLDNIIQIEDSCLGPTGAINKTKNNELGICIHALNIDGDEVRQKFFPQFP